MNCKTILAVLVTALVLSLAACGGGGGGGNSGGGTPPEMQIMPPDDNGDDVVLPPGHTDEPDTAAAAKAINTGEQVTGYLDGPGDVDYFYFSLTEGFHEVTLEIDAPTGTELTVTDDNGNVLATATTASYATLAFPIYHKAGRKLLVKVLGASTVKKAEKYVIRAASKVLQFSPKFIIIERAFNALEAEAGGEIKLNIFEFIKCKYGDKEIKNCELDFSLSGDVSIVTIAGEPVSLGLQGGILTIDAPCEAAGGRRDITFRIAVTANGEVIPNLEASHTVSLEVQESENCPGNDQGGPLGTVEECIAGSAALLPGGLTQAERAIAIEQIRTLCENDPDFGGGDSGTGKTTGDCEATAVVVINRRSSSPPCSIIGTYTSKYTSSFEPTLKDAEDEALRQCRSGSRGFDHCGRGHRPANYWEAKPCTIETSICE